MTKVDEFYNNLFKKLAKEPAKEVCQTCKFAVNSLKDHNKIVHPYAKEADYDEPTYLPQGVQAPDYFSDKLENSPEDNIFVPNDIDEDDQYITNINKLIFNPNQTNEPVSVPGQAKKYTEEAEEKCQICGEPKEKHSYGTHSFEPYKTSKLSSEADYPWDKCHADAMKEYGNSETADKVCGSIKAKSGEDYGPTKGEQDRMKKENDEWDKKHVNSNPDDWRDDETYQEYKQRTSKEANDNMNEDLHDSTMNDDGTNANVGEFPNTEPDAMNTMDTDTAPLAEEFDPELQGKKVKVLSGPKSGRVGVISSVEIFGDTFSIDFNDGSDPYGNSYTKDQVQFLGGVESYATEEIGGMCGICHGEVGNIYTHMKEEHPEKFAQWRKANVSGAEADANGEDMSTGLFDQANPDDSTNEFGEQDANTQEDAMANTSDILSEERMVTLDSGAQMKMHSSPEEYWNELGDDKHAVLRNHGITGDQREDLASKDWKDLPEHVKDAIHNNYSPSTTYYDQHGNKIGESKKKESLSLVEADYSIGTDNPQDLMDSNKTVGKDFEAGEEYDKNIDTNYKCTDCDAEFGDDHTSYANHMMEVHDKDVSSEAGVDDEGYYKPDPDEAFAMTGGKYPSDEDKTEDTTSPDDDAANSGAMSEKLNGGMGQEGIKKPYWGGWKDEDATSGKYKELEPDKKYNEDMGKKLDSILDTIPSKELNTWGQDSIQQHTDDATPLQKDEDNVDGPKTDDYRQAVKDIDAEPSMPMGEAGKSSVGYAFGQMQDVDSKDIPITPAPKFKKKEEPKYDSKYDEPIEEPKDSPHYKGESMVEQDPWFTCPQCSAVFFEESERNSHVDNAHKQQSANSDNLFESMVKDCGCDKGKEAFYKKLGVDWSNEGDLTTWHDPNNSMNKKRHEQNMQEDNTLDTIKDDKKEGDEESPFNNNNWNALGDSPANEATQGVPNDYGKTKSTWCKTCGMGYDETDDVEKHMSDSGHTGSKESFSQEWDAMESFQRYEWLVGKVGAYEVLDNFTGVSQYKWNQLDYGARDKILELAKSSAYSYEFKKKDPKIANEVETVKCDLCDKGIFPITDIGGQANHLILVHDMDPEIAHSDSKGKFFSMEVKKKLSEADTREEATEPDIKKWWDDENNISEKQHAVDPNRLWDIESLEFCKKPYDEHDDAGKRNIWIAYSFRHQEKSLTNLLGYDVHASTKPWWDTYNTSQRQHMFDPHQLFPDSLEFASKKYDDMDDKDKTKADQMYEHKHSETSSARTKKYIKEGLKKLTELGLEGGHGSGRIGHAPWMKPITKKVKSPETSKDIPIEKINEADENLTCKRCGGKVMKVYDEYGPLYVHAIGPRGLMECGPLTKHDVNGATEVWFGEDEPDANHKCPTKNGKCTCDTCDTDVLEGGFVECKNCKLDKPYHHYFDEDENAEEGVLSDYLRRRNGQSYSYCPQCNTVTKHINGMCTNKRPDRLINIPHAPTKQKDIAYYDVMNAEPLDVNADDLE